MAASAQETWSGKTDGCANNQMTNYIMPTGRRTLRPSAYFGEAPYRYGPSGAKGIGELPMDGPAPAILNAVEQATGLRVDYAPLTPELLCSPSS